MKKSTATVMVIDDAEPFNYVSTSCLFQKRRFEACEKTIQRAPVYATSLLATASPRENGQVSTERLSTASQRAATRKSRHSSQTILISPPPCSEISEGSEAMPTTSTVNIRPPKRRCQAREIIDLTNDSGAVPVKDLHTTSDFPIDIDVIERPSHLVTETTAHQPTVEEIQSSLTEVDILGEDGHDGENCPRLGLLHVSESDGQRPSHRVVFVDLEEDENMVFIDLIEDETLRQVQQSDAFHELLTRNSVTRRSTILPTRNLPISLPWLTLDEVKTAKGMMRPGKIVEISDGSFLRITLVMKNSASDQICLRGHILQRHRVLNGIMNKKLNELCWIVERETNDPRRDLEQSVAEVELEEVVKLRKARFTNQGFPACSFRSDNLGYWGTTHAEHEAPVTIRWKFESVFPNSRARLENAFAERSIQLFRQDDLAEIGKLGLAVDDSALRSAFRGETLLGGTHDDAAATSHHRLNTTTKNVVGTADQHFALWHQTTSSGLLTTTNDDERKETRRISGGISTVHATETLIDLTTNFADWHYPKGTERVRKPSSIIRFNESCYGSINTTSPAPSIKACHTQALRASQPHSSGGLRAVSLSSTATMTIPHSGTIHSTVPGHRRILFLRPGQKYTYGDGFCGAGGATRGALMAGLEPTWGFDFSDSTCDTWTANFPNALIYRMAAHQFIALGRGNDHFKVDILHLSPPCQYFSPAHTVIGRDDDMNSASLFACSLLLDVAKPRIVTLEQTFGILHVRFRGFFNSLINIFTDKGFSVRWKIAPLQDWGLPQRRHRLIIIASCPGEKLPGFPPYTHCDPKNPIEGRKPWVSVNSVLEDIRPGDPNHDLRAMSAKPLNMRPWDGSTIAPRCITTHGGQNYHPSGKRGFTNREFAALQGFPSIHKFSQTYVKKQIGNAVPPCIAKLLFSWIKTFLEKEDGVEAEGIVID